MVTFKTQLTALSYYELRGIVTRLRLRSPQHSSSREWIEAAADYWLEEVNSLNDLAHLSTLAKAALWWLCFADAVPAVPFVTEFGQVRRVTGRTRYAPPPWQSPQSAAEELFYCGLLHPLPDEALDQSRLFTLAPELRQRLQPLVAPFAPTGQPSAAPMPLPPDRVMHLMQSVISTLCHDVGHYLIYLYQVQIREGQPITLRHGRWLTPVHLRALAPRLLCPLPVRQLRAHKGTPHLRLLAFLATGAGLQEEGRVTALGWDWLAATAAQQIALLSQVWSSVSQEERTAFGLADGILAAPWPQLFCAGLADCPQPCTTDQLAAAILRANRNFAAYWAAHLPLLQTLASIVTELVATVFLPLGLIVELPTDGDSDSRWFQRTAVGEALVRFVESAPPVTKQNAMATPDPIVWVNSSRQPPTAPVLTTVAEIDAWIVACAAETTLESQARIAGFADYDERESTSFRHHYCISPATVARAAARGLGLPTLQAALQTIGIAVTAAQWQSWSHAHQQGNALSIETVTLLRSRQPTTLATLAGHPRIAATLTEILAPTAAIVGTTVSELAAALVDQGQYPTLVGVPSAPLPNATAASAIAFEQEQMAALWLAGELYTLLGHHLPLPAPPSILPQSVLFAGLPLPMQAAVTAQRQVIADGVATLLDDLPFTPPPSPSDPMQWLPIITAALDRRQLLQMTYFSAGRNLTTQRLVEPYWIEEHNGVLSQNCLCESMVICEIQ